MRENLRGVFWTTHASFYRISLQSYIRGSRMFLELDENEIVAWGSSLGAKTESVHSGQDTRQ